MCCDPCLMLIYSHFKGNEKVKKVFFALANAHFPTQDTLSQATGLTLYHVRDALNFLRGTGLVWGNGCHSLSEGGQRLIELLRDGDQPEPAETLCDNCLLEIGELLPTDGHTVLAQLSGLRAHTRHDLILGTEITGPKLRELLLILEGAQLIQSGRGRVFRLSETGRRLEKLLRRQRASQWDAGVGQSSVGGPLSPGVVAGGVLSPSAAPSTVLRAGLRTGPPKEKEGDYECEDLQTELEICLHRQR